MLAALVVHGGCGINAAVKASRERLVAGDGEAAFRAIDPEARGNDDRAVLLVYAEAAAAIGRDSLSLAAIERVSTRGEKDRRRSEETRDRIWRSLFARAMAVADTLEKTGSDDPLAAERILERAEAYAPGRAATVASLGMFALHAGELERADSLFAATATRSGEDRTAVRSVVTVLVRAAAAHRAAGRIEAAVELGRHASEIAPQDARARFDLGVNLLAMAEERDDPALNREAIAEFEAVLERVPADVDARYDLALARFRLGELDAAREVLVDLLPIAPLEGRVHRLAARVALASGDREGARPHALAMRAVEGEPREVPVSALLVSACAGRGGAKRYALDGPPDRIFAYRERNGSEVEAWFYLDARRAFGFAGGALVGSLDW